MALLAFTVSLNTYVDSSKNVVSLFILPFPVHGTVDAPDEADLAAKCANIYGFARVIYFPVEDIPI